MTKPKKKTKSADSAVTAKVATKLVAAAPAAKAVAAKPARKPGEGRGDLGGMIRARIDPDLKERAERVLERLGLRPSEAIRLFYAQIDLTGGIPFPVRIPNAATRKAMRAADAGELTHHADAAELFEDLGV